MTDHEGAADASTSSAAERFAALYELCHGPIWAYCGRRLSPDLVDDAVAESFLTAWRRLDDVPSGDDALLWMYRVAYRVVGHQWRSLRRRGRLHDRLHAMSISLDAAADETLIAAEEHRIVLDAAARLNPTDAEVLRLTMWEQLTTAEVAEVLGIRPNAVKQRTHRAKRNLAREFRRSELRPTATGGAQ